MSGVEETAAAAVTCEAVSRASGSVNQVDANTDISTSEDGPGASLLPRPLPASPLLRCPSEVQR